ncbi:Aspartate carbamoyltransferase catalytic chain [Piscirickettsia salmonis]|uniref:aspartate carbamoyltransferase n=1 Tax=Piscirickettsia salmonis TaxID=1238 RepID=UPI0012B8F67A|nr:aspartate carbamoyltransferase [Piscirickettsia salmonis]QGP51029.1 Aspartate carbamoyltransferase catalytic chain [Piscirickettsia salmonis]
MTSSLYQQHLLSIQDLDRTKIDLIITTALNFKKNKTHKSLSQLLENKIIASCFYEASTRTRLSFEAAALKLGAKIIGFADARNTSTSKGETLEDSMRIIALYANAIILRHPQEGAAKRTANVSHIPILNAGDGSNQHPTQALLDLVTIIEKHNTLDDLHIGFSGDLKYGRTVHSLVEALIHYQPACLYFISDDSLQIPEYLIQKLDKNNINYQKSHILSDYLNQLDVIYMTRLQKERFDNTPDDYNHNLCLTIDKLENAKKQLQILHPLPRGNEINPAVDHTPYAHYFHQAENGLYTRQALLALTLANNIPTFNNKLS